MTPSEELVALKPCPFCGGPSSTISQLDFWWAECAPTNDSDCAGKGPIRDTEAEAIAAWNTRQSTDLIERLPDVERIRAEAFEEAAKVAEKFLEAQSPPDIGANSRTKSIALAIRSLSPRPDPRQDEVERVARALYRADFLQTCEIHGNKISPDFNFDWAWDQSADAPLSGPPFVAKWKGLARASIASMDPVRQVANELREALRFYANEWEQDVDAELTANGWEGSVGSIQPTEALCNDFGQKARSALASADAVLGEGE